MKNKFNNDVCKNQEWVNVGCGNERANGSSRCEDCSIKYKQQLEKELKNETKTTEA